MIKRIVSIIAALALLMAAAGLPAAAAPQSSAKNAAVMSSGPDDPGEPTDPPAPTPEPTPAPTEAPTDAPTEAPTEAPTDAPTDQPTDAPTDAPSDHLMFLTGSELPGGTVGQAYSVTLQTNFSDTVFNAAGGDFEAVGVIVTSGGVITGTPKAAGKFSLIVSATSAAAGETIQKSFTLAVAEGGGSTTPTPTPKPTPRPTNPTPRPTDSTPVPTAVPGQTYQPTQEPTIPGSSTAFWTGAAETVQKVTPNTPFELKLVEGLKDDVTYKGPSGSVPDSVIIKDGMEGERSISVSGTLMNGQIVELGFRFEIPGKKTIMLGFTLVCTDEENGEAPSGGFPAGRHMIPFGGERSAAAVVPGRRKEDEEL